MSFKKKKQYNIVFTGEFSSGKSSLINAILGVEFLDVDIVPTTERLYKLFYSQKAYEKLVKINDIEIFECGYPFEFLKDSENLVLWDTPGLNSDDTFHEKHLDYALSIADVIILVLDSSFGTIKATSLNKLKKYKRKPLGVIFSKVDKVAYSEFIKAREQILSILKKFFKNILFIEDTSIMNKEKIKKIQGIIKLLV